jgi:hypothetical protein
VDLAERRYGREHQRTVMLRAEYQSMSNVKGSGKRKTLMKE